MLLSQVTVHAIDFLGKAHKYHKYWDSRSHPEYNIVNITTLLDRPILRPVMIAPIRNRPTPRQVESTDPRHIGAVIARAVGQVWHCDFRG